MNCIQIQTFPLSAKQLSAKQRFISRGSIFTHLTTHKNRGKKTCCWSDLYRPTSVERKNRLFNQIHHKETLLIDTAPRNQTQPSSTSSNSYQGSSACNRHSPQLFGTNLFYHQKTFHSFKTTPQLNPPGVKRLTPMKRFLWDK